MVQALSKDEMIFWTSRWWYGIKFEWNTFVFDYELKFFKFCTWSIPIHRNCILSKLTIRIRHINIWIRLFFRFRGRCKFWKASFFNVTVIDFGNAAQMLVTNSQWIIHYVVKIENYKPDEVILILKSQILKIWSSKMSSKRIWNLKKSINNKLLIFSSVRDFFLSFFYHKTNENRQKSRN